MNGHIQVDVGSTAAVAATWLLSIAGFIPVMAAVIVSVTAAIYYVLMISSHPSYLQWALIRRTLKTEKLRAKLFILEANNKAATDIAMMEAKVKAASTRE